MKKKFELGKDVEKALKDIISINDMPTTRERDLSGTTAAECYARPLSYDDYEDDFFGGWR